MTRPILTVFESVSLDGYFTDADGDTRWAYEVPPDRDFDAFVAGNARGGGALLLGRVTYELMASYWPTPAAAKNAPVVAERMNAMTKYVFSRTLRDASWSNTVVVKGDVVAEARRLKREASGDLTVLGSGTLVAPLVQAGLVDELRLVMTPVVLGEGRTPFEDVAGPSRMKLVSSRTFKNGKVSLVYHPITGS